MVGNLLIGLVSPRTYWKLNQASVLNETRVRDYSIKLTFLELRKTHRADESIRICAEELFLRSEERIRAVVYKEKPTARELWKLIQPEKAESRDDKTMRIPFRNFWRDNHGSGLSE